MTKREYCLTHEPVACHDYYRMQIHGIEYGINDYVYISRLYHPTICGATKAMFHKVKINYDADGTAYVKISERFYDNSRYTRRLNLDSFICVDSPWGCPAHITCAELEML